MQAVPLNNPNILPLDAILPGKLKNFDDIEGKRPILFENDE